MLTLYASSKQHLPEGDHIPQNQNFVQASYLTNDINKIHILLKKHLCHNISYIKLLP